MARAHPMVTTPRTAKSLPTVRTSNTAPLVLHSRFILSAGNPSAVIVTESRAATEARIATLRAQLTVDAAKLLNPDMAKVLVPILLQAIEAALKAKLWAGESECRSCA